MIDVRVEVAHALVEPAIAGRVEDGGPGQDLERVEVQRERRWPRHAVPAGDVVQRDHAVARVVDLHDRPARLRAAPRHHLRGAPRARGLLGGAAAAGRVVRDRHRVDAGVDPVRAQLDRRDRRDPAVEPEHGDLVVEIAAPVVIAQRDDADARRGQGHDPVHLGHGRVGRRRGVDVQIGGHRVARIEGAHQRRLDDDAPLAERDLARPALVLDAAPHPDRVAPGLQPRAVTARRGERDRRLAPGQHQAVPRAQRAGRQPAGAAGLALAQEVADAEAHRLIAGEERDARRDQRAARAVGDAEDERGRRTLGSRTITATRRDRGRGEHRRRAAHCAAPAAAARAS